MSNEEFWGAHELVEDLVTEDYSWSAVGVFRRKSDGALFWATDSGCSCYGTWEQITEADLTPFRDSKLMEFREDVKGVATEVEELQFIRDMEALLR